MCCLGQNCTHNIYPHTLLPPPPPEAVDPVVLSDTLFWGYHTTDKGEISADSQEYCYF